MNLEKLELSELNAQELKSVDGGFALSHNSNMELGIAPNESQGRDGCIPPIIIIKLPGGGTISI